MRPDRFEAASLAVAAIPVSVLVALFAHDPAGWLGAGRSMTTPGLAVMGGLSAVAALGAVLGALELRGSRTITSLGFGGLTAVAISLSATDPSVGLPALAWYSWVAYLLSSSIAELGKQVQARGGDTGAAALRVAWRTRAWAGVITAFVFAAMIWTATHLYRTVVSPLTDMARTARAMTHGEENRRFHAGGRDELGELATLLNSLADRLFAQEREADQRDTAHEQILESVLDRWSEGLAVVDRTGRLLAANSTFRRLLRGNERDARASELRLGEDTGVLREPLVFRGRREFGELLRLPPSSRPAD